MRRGSDKENREDGTHMTVIQATSSITGHHSLLPISSLPFVPSISSILRSLMCANNSSAAYCLTVRGVVVTVGGRKSEKSRIPIGKVGHPPEKAHFSIHLASQREVGKAYTKTNIYIIIKQIRVDEKDTEVDIRKILVDHIRIEI